MPGKPVCQNGPCVMLAEEGCFHDFRLQIAKMFGKPWGKLLTCRNPLQAWKCVVIYRVRTRYCFGLFGQLATTARRLGVLRCKHKVD